MELFLSGRNANIILWLAHPNDYLFKFRSALGPLGFPANTQ
jgi:hypothetical protein